MLGDQITRTFLSAINMASRDYKPGELFRRTMLARAANPSRNEGNSLAAEIKHSPDDDVIVQLICESLRGGAVRDQPSNKSKGKRKGTNFFIKKHKEIAIET